MTRLDPSEIDAEPGERERLLELADRLDRERPVCAPGFRGELRRSLLVRLGAGTTKPERLRALILAYAGSGLAMLAVAALGVGGIGPLAAG
ncbi:MAG: hypothetical protein R2700_15595 [Solirubrobacterales bacterium]